MSIEFIFEENVYPCKEMPADFTSLLIALKKILRESLPEVFGLQYEDSDGDKIMLLSEEDYRGMLENDGPIKIHVTAASKDKSIGKFEVKEEIKINEKEDQAIPIEKNAEEAKPQSELEKPAEKQDQKVSSNDKPKAEQPIISENKANLEVALEKAEKKSESVHFDEGLEAKVNALVLKAFKNNLEVVAGAVRENILNARERNKPITSVMVVESLVYLQKLVQGIERASESQIQKLEQTLEEAINICKIIDQQEVPKHQQKPEVIEEQKKELEKGENVQEKPIEKAEVGKNEELKEKEIEPTNKQAELEPKNDLDGELIREVDQVPNELKEKEKIPIYKTIMVKNTGRETYPPGVYLECVDHKEYNRSNLQQIEPGKESAVVLILESTGKPGIHTADWEFRVKLPDGTVTTFGKRFTVRFEVMGCNVQGNCLLKEGVLTFYSLDTKNEAKAEGKDIIYPQEIKEKAREVKEVFPQLNIDDICEYVSKNSKKSLEELFEYFMTL